MRIVSWNVRYFSHAALGLTSLDRTLRQVAKTLAELQPQADIIALQEIDNLSVRGAWGRTSQRRRRGEPVPNFDRFMQRLNEVSRAAGGYSYRALFFPAQGVDREFPLYSTGLAVIFRESLECVEHNAEAPREITHRRLKAFAKLKQKRICAHVRFAESGTEPFDLYNTHLSLPAFLKPGSSLTRRGFGEASNQLAEAQAVLQHIDEQRLLPRTVLLGDFNSVPASQVYAHLTTTLRDAHAHHLGVSPHELRKFHTGGFWRFRYRLDHIFCGDEITVQDFNGTHPLSPQHPLRHLSDHAPLIARLSV